MVFVYWRVFPMELACLWWKGRDRLVFRVRQPLQRSLPMLRKHLELHVQLTGFLRPRLTEVLVIVWRYFDWNARDMVKWRPPKILVNTAAPARRGLDTVLIATYTKQALPRKTTQKVKVILVFDCAAISNISQQTRHLETDLSISCLSMQLAIKAQEKKANLGNTYWWKGHTFWDCLNVNVYCKFSFTVLIIGGAKWQWRI